MFLNVDSCSMYWRYKWKNISDIKYDFCVTKPVQDALIKHTYIYIISVTAINLLAINRPQRSVCVACRVSTIGARLGDEHEVLFCPSGPSDLHIHWLINGHSLASPIEEYRRPVGPGEVLVSSWLREGPLIRDARYHCVAEAGTGSDASEVDLRLTIGGIWTWSLHGCENVQSVWLVSQVYLSIKTNWCLPKVRWGGGIECLGLVSAMPPPFISIKDVVIWQMRRAFHPGIWTSGEVHSQSMSNCSKDGKRPG